MVVSDSAIFDVSELTSSLRYFVTREEAYRMQFLQKNYGHGFDGYSYCGQEDSSHQAADDLLHSFVLSEFYPAARFPVEFHSYLARDWQPLISVVRDLESSILRRALPAYIYDQYRASMGHMLSANYYPPVGEFDHRAEGGGRLSAHPDVSLLTVFPYGIDRDFQYRDNRGQWRHVPATDRIVAFPGYLLQWLTNGAVQALDHRVCLSADAAGSERFSFAIFSLPRPGAVLYRETPAGREEITAENYFREYLSLWDY